MLVQHAEIIFFFVVVVVPTTLIVALFSGHLVRLIVRRRVIQCGLQAFSEVLKVAYSSGFWFEHLNLHLTLPLDGDSKL